MAWFANEFPELITYRILGSFAIDSILVDVLLFKKL